MRHRPQIYWLKIVFDVYILWAFIISVPFSLFSSKVEKSLLHYSPEYRCNTILIDLKTRQITNRLTFDSRIYFITSPQLTGLRAK